MGMKNHRSPGLRGVSARRRRHRARSWLLTMLGLAALAACAPASVRSARAVASADTSGSGLELDAPAHRRAPGAERLEKQHDAFLRRRAHERLRLQLHIRDHDSRIVRDGG
jgi:hypothetical protein